MPSLRRHRTQVAVFSLFVFTILLTWATFLPQSTAATSVIATIPSGTVPNGVAVNTTTNRIYVVNEVGNVAVIDGATNQILTSVTVGTTPVGIAVNQTTNRIYVANSVSNNVSVINGATNTVEATITVGVAPDSIGVNENTNRIYVSNFSSDAVSVINGATNTLLAAIAVGRQPRGVSVNPVTNKIYVANQASADVSVINGATNAVESIVSVGGNPFGVGVNTITNRIYVSASPTITSITVIDGATDTLETTIPSEQNTAGLAVNSVNNRIYVANPNANTVAVINGANNIQEATLNVGSLPFKLAVNTVTNRVYVTNQNSNNTSVIQDTNFAIVGRITNGSLPVSGIVVNLTGTSPATTTTDANGNYAFQSLMQGGSYTVTPSSQSNGFTPPSRTFDNLQTNQTAADFTALSTTLTVTNTNDSGAGSLRQAILDSNATTGTQTIAFNIPGSGVRTIAGSQLPTITDPVVIDGYTQPGARPNTLAQGSDAVLLVELSGTGAGSSNGFSISANDCTIRGLVINRFSAGSGITIRSNNNVVQGNFVGTNAAGTAAAPNQFGVNIPSGTNNLIGGTTPAARNVISGNTFSNPNGSGNVGFGILTDTTSAGSTRIQGNFIGTDAGGTLPLGNSNAGIGVGTTTSSLEPTNNTIGGDTLEAGNRIAFNGGDGVSLRDIRPNNTIRFNTIFSNGGNGVNVNGANNTILSNSIFSNGGDGVNVSRDTNNAIRSNSIFSNGGLGISLGGNFVTPNDTGDADTGANNLQNFPVLTSAANSDGTTTIQGTLNSTANTAFNLEFFANTTCDGSGNGEGQFTRGMTTITTDANGNASFTHTTIGVGGEFITATATDAAGNTSEFSACRQVTAELPQVDISVTKTDSPDPITAGNALTYTIGVTNNPTPSGTPEASGVVVTDALPSGVRFVSATSSSGSCSQANNTVTCNLGTLPGGNSATVSIVVTPTQAGTLTNTASVTSTNADTNTANNSATQSTTVNAAVSTFSISGRVANPANTALVGVNVRVTDAGGQTIANATSDANGNYTIANLVAGGSYIVTPSGENLTFTPSRRSFNNLAANQINVNFTGANITFRAIRDAAGFRANVLPANDDGSTGRVPLGFTVNFFGNNYDGLFVNNNGNVTFDRAISTFTPFDLTTTQSVIIAAFFTDIDTRGAGSGLVTYGTDTVNGRPAFGANWINVGYFSGRTDKLNSFQIVIIDRSDIEAGSFEIELNYDKVQFEIGDSQDGLGSPSARAGFSNGSRTPGTFFELGGSGVTGAFLDTNPTTGLINNNLNSPQPGRYAFSTRGGIVSTFAISGRVTDAGGAPVSNVTVALSGATNISTTTDQNGNYTFAGLAAGGDYTVTPSRDNTTFAPPNRAFTNLQASQTADFQATNVSATLSISGRVTDTNGIALAGVTVTLTDSPSSVTPTTSTTTTDQNGNYTFGGLTANRDYSVSASAPDIAFQPPRRDIPALASSQTGIDFVGTRRVVRPPAGNLQITGRITTADDAGVANIAVTLSGTVTATTTTDANGNFVFTGLAPGTYSVTPTTFGFTFTPARRDFSNITSNQTADFAAVAQANPTPTPFPQDGFNDPATTAQNFNRGTLSQAGSFDPNIPVVIQNGQLEITPRATSGSPSFNGLVSVRALDLVETPTVSVEVRQVTNGGAAQTVFAVGSSPDDFFRFLVSDPTIAPASLTFDPTNKLLAKKDASKKAVRPLGGTGQQLSFQAVVNGQSFVTGITYNPVQHRFWRFRNDAVRLLVFFETSPDAVTWTTQFPRAGETYPTLAPGSTNALAAELAAGTLRSTANPGSAVFDNFVITNPPGVGFAATDFSVPEGQSTAVITITRTGNTDGAARVNFTTADRTAQAGVDYTPASGTLDFAAGERSKTITINLLSNSALGDRTIGLILTNPVGTVVVPGRDIVPLTIIDDDDPRRRNPIDDGNFFTRQQILDIFNRQITPTGNVVITRNGLRSRTRSGRSRTPRFDDKRAIEVAALLNSSEFANVNAFIARLYRTAFGRPVTLMEFVADAQSLAAGAITTDGRINLNILNRNRANLVTEFMARSAFMTRYQNLGATEYVDALYANTGIAPPSNERAALILGLITNRETRGTVLRRITDNQTFVAREANRTIALFAFFDFFRADPDAATLAALTERINRAGSLLASGILQEFLNSPQFRARFGRA